MAGHQLSESFVASLSQVAVNGLAADERNENPQNSKKKLEEEKGNGPVNSVEVECVSNSQMLPGRNKSSSSESEWKTTSDTSIHSPPSDHQVPLDVLEAIDGMDEMCLSSPHRPSTLVTSKGRGLGRGRGRCYRRVSNGRKPVQARAKHVSESSSSSGSSHSSSSSHSDSYSNSDTGSDSDSDSNSDSESSSGSSHSSSSSEVSSHSSDSSHSSYSSGSSEGSCTGCCCDCSCSCHEDYSSSASSTSYESTDDLTDLPRVKRGGRLGYKGAKKVAEQCAQS